MTESTLITDYLGRGLAAARPASLSVATNALALYYATDTDSWAYWNGSGWTALPAGSVSEVVAGAGLSGGTISVAGTLAANWQQGTVTALGSNVSIVGGTLEVAAGVGSVTEIVAGAGLSGGTITSAGTLSLGTIAAGGFLVNPGSVAAVPSAGVFGTNLTLTPTGTLNATGGVSQWTAGTVTALGAGLADTGGTLTVAQQWNAGSVTAVSGGTISGGTLTIAGGSGQWNAGSVTAIGSGLVLSGATLAASSGAAEWSAGNVGALASGLAILSTAPPPYLDGPAVSNNGGGVGGNTATITLSTAAANTVVIVAVKSYYGMSPGTTTVTAPGLTFTLRKVSGTLQLWWAPAASPLSAVTITATFPSNCGDWGMIAFGVVGCNISAPFDTSGTLPMAVSTLSPTGINTVAADTLLLFVVGGGGSGTETPVPSGYTALPNMTYDYSLGAMAGLYCRNTAALSGAAISWTASGWTGVEGIVDALVATATPTLTPEWQAGTVSAVAGGTISSGTLSIPSLSISNGVATIGAGTTLGVADGLALTTTSVAPLVAAQRALGAVHQYVMGDSGSVAVDTGSSPANGIYSGTYSTAASLIVGGGPSTYLNNGYLTCPFIDPPMGTGGAFSIEMVINENSQVGDVRLAANGHTDTLNQGMQFLGGGGDVGFTGGTANFGPTWDTHLSFGTVHHLVLTYDGTHLVYYVDGVQQSSGTPSGTYVGGSNNFAIGWNPSFAGGYCIGYYQAVAFYNFGLSSAQVAANYAAVSSGSSAPSYALDVATSLRSVPLPFSFSGKPAAGQMVHVPLINDVPLTLPANFTGAAVYVGTNPTSAESFVLSKVNAGTVTSIGTVSVGTTGSITLSSTAYASASGDVLRLTAPATQDATMADIGITFEAKRP